jgi:hypothetical protein
LYRVNAGTARNTVPSTPVRLRAGEQAEYFLWSTMPDAEPGLERRGRPAERAGLAAEVTDAERRAPAGRHGVRRQLADFRRESTRRSRRFLISNELREEMFQSQSDSSPTPLQRPVDSRDVADYTFANWFWPARGCRR